MEPSGPARGTTGAGGNGLRELAAAARCPARACTQNARASGLVEWLTENAMKPGYDYIHEFAYGIEFILDGLERARTTPKSAPAAD